MKELVSQQQAELVMLALAAAGIVVAAIAAAGRPSEWWEQGKRRAGGIYLGALLVLNYGAWKAYNYIVRFDPKSGYNGLDSVKVTLGLMGAFALLGAVGGWLWRKLPEGKASPTNKEAGGQGNGEGILRQ